MPMVVREPKAAAAYLCAEQKRVGDGEECSRFSAAVSDVARCSHHSCRGGSSCQHDMKGEAGQR